jgi:hypothetical protein
LPQLGDCFPEPFRRSFLANQFGPGSIIRLFCDFTHPQPKNKYLVVMSVTPLLFFAINSQVNNYIQQRPHLKACQIILRSSEYTFLGHDSYLDCSEVIDSLRVDDIMNQLMSDTSRAVGALNLVQVQNIMSVIHPALSISRKHKCDIEAALGSAYDLFGS